MLFLGALKMKLPKAPYRTFPDRIQKKNYHQTKKRLSKSQLTPTQQIQHTKARLHPLPNLINSFRQERIITAESVGFYSYTSPNSTRPKHKHTMRNIHVQTSMLQGNFWNIQFGKRRPTRASLNETDRHMSRMMSAAKINSENVKWTRYVTAAVFRHSRFSCVCVLLSGN